MERESMEYDVIIVGAGPSGLSAAIRLKQLANEQSKEINVCVLEKGSEVGAHILSGNVFDPKALNELIPDWKEQDTPVKTSVLKDEVKYLINENSSISVPLLFAPTFKNHGNYIISLANLCRWLGDYAEGLGVDIFPGYTASEIIYEDDCVIGVGADVKTSPDFPISNIVWPIAKFSQSEIPVPVIAKVISYIPSEDM